MDEQLRHGARRRARGAALAAVLGAFVGGCGKGGEPVPTGPALPVGSVGHEGRWLTDETGRVLLPHGVNMVQKTAPYTPASAGFSDADAAWLEANGFRLVRVGVLPTGVMPTPGTIDAGYIAQIAATVQNLASHGIYSLLDFHQDGWGPSIGDDGFPAWMTLTGSAVNNHATFPLYYIQDPAIQAAFQSFWDDAPGPDGKGIQESYAAMMTAVAKQFASEPYVLGYDLFNEPWPGTTWNPCLNDANGCPSLDTGELGPLYGKAVAAIRAAGDEHIIFGEPFVLFNQGESTTSMPVPGGDAKAGMSFHVYPLLESLVPKVIDNATAWAAQTGGALLNTEWGATEDTTVLNGQSLALDEALVPWIFWSFCCELLASLGAPPSTSNLVSTSVASLVVAHPLAVAGTPQQLARDPVAQTLTFTWSTERPGGGAFAAGTVTTFEVPATTYPKGYSVKVQNGSVRSTACAPLLTVLADEGATTVTVSLTPGGVCP
jgi:endoglycosylceramidase